MNKPYILLTAFLLGGAVAGIASDADAQQRVRGRVVAHGAEGGRVAVTRAAARGENGAYARGRKVVSGERGVYARGHGVHGDGEGNVTGRSGAYLETAAGGSAARQGSFYRDADGSAGRQGSAYVQTAAGGTASTSGSITRDADGDLDGGRSTTATGRNGNSYSGSTTVSDGSVSRTASCTNAAGEAIDCRGDG